MLHINSLRIIRVTNRQKTSFCKGIFIVVFTVGTNREIYKTPDNETPGASCLCVALNTEDQQTQYIIPLRKQPCRKKILEKKIFQAGHFLLPQFFLWYDI